MPEVAGSGCVLCRQKIDSLFDGVFCQECGGPYHHKCFNGATARAAGRCGSCGADLMVVAAESEQRRASQGGRTKTCPFCDATNAETVGRCQCGYTFGQTVEIATACPTCGGTTYRRTRPRRRITFVWDRICKGCKTRYAPPTPLWAAIIFALVGCLIVAEGLWHVLRSVVNESPFIVLIFAINAVWIFLGALLLRHGVRSMFRSVNKAPPSVSK
jgi:hypothetical protein